MSTCVHPEETVDMALGGTLTTAQRRDLNLHLADCAACSAHMVAAQGTKETLANRPTDEQLNRRAVERAMTGLFPPRFARLRNRRAFQLGFALAGLLLVAGLAGAALWRSQRPMSVPLPSPEPSAATHAVLAVPAPAEPIADPAPAANDAILQRTPRAQPSAAALFAQALALRAEGKVDAAIAAHLRLQRLYPTARETGLSFALAGRLLLEKGASEQALAQFNQYLARPGDVAEEALVGRATALEHLGRSAAEAAAWQQVLERHPGSIYAARAKERLAALGAKRKAATER